MIMKMLIIPFISKIPKLVSTSMGSRECGETQKRNSKQLMALLIICLLTIRANLCGGKEINRIMFLIFGVILSTIMKRCLLFSVIPMIYSPLTISTTSPKTQPTKWTVSYFKCLLSMGALVKRNIFESVLI